MGMLHPKPSRPNTGSHGTPTALSYKSFRWCRRGVPGKNPSYFRRYSLSKLLTPSSQPHTWINSNENFAERSPSQISEWILPADAPLEWAGNDLLSSSCGGLFRSPITEAGASYEYLFRPDSFWSEVPEYGSDMSQSRAGNVKGWADISGAETGGGPSLFSVSQQRSPSDSSKVRAISYDTLQSSQHYQTYMTASFAQEYSHASKMFSIPRSR